MPSSRCAQPRGVRINTPRRFDAGHSDLDVLVEFQAQAADSFSNFLDLKESLEALFQRSVDLVELRAMRNRRLRYYIEQSKSSIYAGGVPELP